MKNVSENIREDRFLDTNPNTMEFTVKKKTDAVTVLQRILIVVASFTPLVIALATFFFVVPFMLIISCVSIWFFMRFTKIEYEYSIISGDFSVAAIYDNVRRKELVEAKISNMNIVAPYESDHIRLHLHESARIKRTLDYHTDAEYKDFYFCVYNDEKHGKTAIIFNANEKMIKIMKFYNSQNVILKSKFEL